MSCRHKLDFEAVIALVGSRLLEKAGEWRFDAKIRLKSLVICQPWRAWRKVFAASTLLVKLSCNLSLSAWSMNDWLQLHHVGITG